MNFGVWTVSTALKYTCLMKTMGSKACDVPIVTAKMCSAGSVASDLLVPEYDEVLDRLESGQSPEDIESDMPELGSETGGMGAGGFPDL